MFDSTLDLEITETFQLERFEIKTILIIPATSAVIAITIFASNKKQYERIFQLIGKDYTDWTEDSYPSSYIKKNIESIFSVSQKETVHLEITPVDDIVDDIVDYIPTELFI